MTARVRDRKLNELMTFAALIRLEPENRQRYASIMDGINRDLDVCEALISSDGKVSPPAGTIDDRLYTSRLSDRESQDESAFNGYKSQVDNVDEDPMRDYVRGLIEDAVSSISKHDDGSAEAISSLKDELRMCRERIEQLSNELDFANTRASEAESESEELRSLMESMKNRDRGSSDTDGADESEPECTDASSSDEGAFQEPSSEAIRIPEGRILSDDQIKVLGRILELKTSKEDEFISESMTADDDRIDVCDDIVTFLKVDIGICSALLGMDQEDPESIMSAFTEIVSILEDAPDPMHQDSYVSTLTPQESLLEHDYGIIIQHVQDIMLDMYSGVE